MIIDANMYWFDVDLFTDKVFSDRFLSEIENANALFTITVATLHK